MRVVTDGGKRTLKAGPATDLSFKDRLKSFFHIGEFNFSQIVEVVEKALLHNPFSGGMGANLSSLENRVQNSYFLHKSEQKNLIKRIEGLKTQKTEAPLTAPYEWEDASLKSLAEILLDSPNALRYFQEKKGISQQAYDGKFIQMANLENAVRAARDLKDGRTTDMRDSIVNSLCEALKAYMTGEDRFGGLKKLCTMFNIRVQTKDENGNEATIEPSRIRGESAPLPPPVPLKEVRGSNGAPQWVVQVPTTRLP